MATPARHGDYGVWPVSDFSPAHHALGDLPAPLLALDPVGVSIASDHALVWLPVPRSSVDAVGLGLVAARTDSRVLRASLTDAGLQEVAHGIWSFRSPR